MNNASLRSRLLWLLLVAIAVTAVVQGFVAYQSASAAADEVFDYHMQQMALTLRSGARSSGPDEAAGEADDGGEDYIVQVWTQDGLRIFESAPRAVLPQRAVMGFANVPANGTTYRVFSLQSHGHVIQVAQDLQARHQLARAMALRTLWPVALMAPILMLLVWWSVSYSLRPLQRVRQQLARRQADDLGMIHVAELPEELQPLVADLNLLLERLRGAFEAQAHFVADAAHELRSPLAALKLQVQASQRAADEATRVQALQRLGAGIERASHLVDQLLTLARQQGQDGADMQPCDLGELARDSIAHCAAQAHEAGIDLGLASAEAPAVAGHPEALRILLRNLVDNALKYTPRGGTIDVSTALEGAHPVLRVEDSGPGIPAGERQRVLDRFYRVANAGGFTGEGITGSGLGLAIVRSIAQWHRAEVHLSGSARLGGLRVDIVFPEAAGST